jgi:hypothetical protein
VIGWTISLLGSPQPVGGAAHGGTRDRARPAVPARTAAPGPGINGPGGAQGRTRTGGGPFTLHHAQGTVLPCPGRRNRKAGTGSISSPAAPRVHAGHGGNERSKDRSQQAEGRRQQTEGRGPVTVTGREEVRRRWPYRPCPISVRVNTIEQPRRQPPRQPSASARASTSPGPSDAVQSGPRASRQRSRPTPTPATRPDRIHHDPSLTGCSPTEARPCGEGEDRVPNRASARAASSGLPGRAARPPR